MKAWYSTQKSHRQRSKETGTGLSTRRGSGAVILNVIFTEATREFLWAIAKC